jgi:uncharacterized protein (TIGR02246 family)
MNSQTTQASADQDAIRAIHQRMIDAWNAGDAAAFAAPFTDDADFIAFEGTHLKGRREIASFHHQIFDTVVKGTRLQGEVKFVRFLGPALAVMHSGIRVTLQGQTEGVTIAGFDATDGGGQTRWRMARRGTHECP